MSRIGLHVSLSAFRDAIVQRKWGLCPHFAFHGMFHEINVQRKHTWHGNVAMRFVGHT